MHGGRISCCCSEASAAQNEALFLGIMCPCAGEILPALDLRHGWGPLRISVASAARNPVAPPLAGKRETVDLAKVFCSQSFFSMFFFFSVCLLDTLGVLHL